MATRTKTIEYAFDPRLTPLATNTTLGTATRYDAAALTVYVPETTRTFKSVILRISWRCAITTTASNVTGWRMGIKLGAVAFDDLDLSPTAQGNTGDHEWGYIDRDVTAYFVTNFGAGASQTAQAGFAMSHAAANNVNNVTMKLIITYEYDDAATTHVKTVRIPIMSHHALLTTSQVELGTTGGANNAGANQIPTLDSFLPETSKTIRRAWLEVHSNDAGNATTTDINFIYQIDAATEVTHVLCEQGLATSVAFYTHIIYNTGTFATNAGHAFKARGDVTSRFDTCGAVLYVTYEFDPASTTHLNSLYMPMDIPPSFVDGVDGTDNADYRLELWVEEPATITMQQSGCLLYPHAIAGGTLSLKTGGATVRDYTLTSGLGAGGYALVHRIDHGTSPVTLNRGRNRIDMRAYVATNQQVGTLSGFWIINYHSGKAAGGCGVHNHSRCWFTNAFATGAQAAFNEIATTNQKTPVIVESEYWLNNVGYEVGLRCAPGAASANIYVLRAEALSGEFLADGWIDINRVELIDDAELAVQRAVLHGTPAFNKSAYETGKLNVETARKYRLQSSGSNPLHEEALWLTYHCITFNVSGTISGYMGDGSGITVYAHSVLTGEIVGVATTAAGGTFTVKVYDSANNHYAEAFQDAQHLGRSPEGIPT